MKRFGEQIRQALQLMEKSGGALRRKTCCRIATRERCGSRVKGSRPAVSQTPGEELTSPDGSVVAVAGSVEADAHRPLFPSLSLRHDGGDMSAMMLDRQPC